MNNEKSCLVKITDEIFVRKDDVLVVDCFGKGKRFCTTRITMKHQVYFCVPDLTPQQVMNRLDGLDEKT